MSPTGRKTYHHGDLRGALIRLAVETTEREGPEALSLRSLADHAGVSRMAPYRHFADKADLLEAVALHGFGILLEEFRRVDDPADPGKAILSFGIVYVCFACDHPGLFRLMFGGPPPTSNSVLTRDTTTVFGLFAVRLKQLAPDQDQNVALLALWSMAHGLATLLSNGRVRGNEAPPAKLAERLLPILMQGLLGPQGEANSSIPVL